MKSFKIFAINPGSTSTKIALFLNEEIILSENIVHSTEELAPYPEINDQLNYRKEIIIKVLEEAGQSLKDVDAFVGRGGGFKTVKSGVLEVNDLMLKDAYDGFAGQHPCNLAVQLANEFVSEFGGVAYTVNPPVVDELQDLARATGLKNVYRKSSIHALNQKEVGIRYAESKGKNYEELNLVIAHLGGGISVTAHSNGRMIDSSDNINGDGPMSPNRAGSIPALSILRLAFSGTYTEKELEKLLTREAGWTNHVGIADGIELGERIKNGDLQSKFIHDALGYQIAKNIGSYATVLKGNVEAIILTGGLSYDDSLVEMIKEMTGYIAPVVVMPGEFEMEALAAGALRVFRGEEEAQEYTGESVWQGFNFEEENETWF